jgi:SNF2 family DNA or RNA helicase
MQRKSALDRFNTDPECTIFILSIRSGGVGLTLTAAQHIWMFEPHPNPALTQQAIHRCHRVGQTKEVFIHHLLMQDSVEEKIFAQTKAKLEVALQEEESGASAPASARAANNYRMRADELAALFA